MNEHQSCLQHFDAIGRWSGKASKQDVSTSLGMWHGWATRLTCPGPYIYQFVGYPRLEAPPRTSASHLASDPGSRPSAVQSWPELSMATCPGHRMLEAARGNGHAPVRGTPVMMMMTKGIQPIKTSAAKLLRM